MSFSLRVQVNSADDREITGERQVKSEKRRGGRKEGGKLDFL